MFYKMSLDGYVTAILKFSSKNRGETFKSPHNSNKTASFKRYTKLTIKFNRDTSFLWVTSYNALLFGVG